jgi:phosphoglycolate phosphatase
VNILFDLDGTLTDSYQGITRSISYALTTLGRTPPPQESLAWCIGPPLKKSFSLLLDSIDEELVSNALVVFRERFRTVGMFENEVYRGVPGMLDALQQKGHTLYVATSKPAVFANRIVDHFGLCRYFQGVYGSELDGKRGDKKSLILHILTCERIDLAMTTMVGDRKHDMIGARANGVRGLGALWGYGTREELEASGAYACFSSPSDLVPVFNKKTDPFY